MVNDLLSFVKNSVPETESLLYADDLVIWSTGSDISMLEKTLNLALEALTTWTLDNEFKVNPEKTNFELFTLSTKTFTVNLVYKNSALTRTDSATYLGITLDTRLTWNKYIEQVTDRVVDRLCLLKRLAGIKWGSSQSVLTSTFTSYIKPVLDYGSEVLITASDSTLSKLDLVQNKALRLITGAAVSTPFPAMQLQTKIFNLTDRQIKASLSLAERLFRKEHFWPDYILPYTRLKSQHSFLFECQRLAETFEVSNSRLGIYKPSSYTGLLRYAVARFDLVQPVKKSDSHQTEMYSIALATIHERYPDQDWFRVYTDGSATPSAGRAGAYSKHFSLQEPLDTWADNFNGEMNAIFMAIRSIGEPAEQNIVLFVDSQAAIQTITDYNLYPSELDLESKKSIDSLLRSGREVVFQWIPGHCGIYGNGRADILAKGAASLHPLSRPVPLRNGKRLLTSKIQHATVSALRNKADGKPWACLLDDEQHTRLSLLPRALGVASFRTITGHDYLQAHLYKINLADSPLCEGSSPMTAEHLYRCSSLHDIHNCDDFQALTPFEATSLLYWTARRLMFERTMVGID
ncbi:uncharacterized protein LOC129222479 [Uloborus diversus]|uniref:uncharacterized protein LOC129222479 n=1 Tax=Uloborus diversus TaxID=327109 RepID=UPI00240A23AA|nr:uncharacterized protein LOC129222479 [Uloborus diversus]